MGRGEVKLSFTGDPKGLERAFDRAGQSAKDMATDFDTAASQAKSMSGRVDAAGTAVGNQEGKFMGVADVLDGLSTAMGFNIGRQIELARAAGDIAGGVENLKGTVSGSLDTLKKYATQMFGSSVATNTASVSTAANTTVTETNTVATKAQTIASKAQAVAAKGAAIAQGVLNAVMNLNPAFKIALIVAALTAAIVVAYRESETFRKIVKGAFNAVKGPAEAALKVINGVVEAIKGVLRFLGILDDKTASTKADTVKAFGDISQAAAASARASGTTVPSSFVGGRDLVTRHSGGMVPGPRGVPTPIMALGGERVLSPGRSGGASSVVNVQALDARGAAGAVRQALIESLRTNGPIPGLA